jgi:hypothetical protein
MTLGFNRIDLEETDQRKIVTITFKGKVEKEDYDMLVPQLEGIIEKGGSIRLLVELKDFKGWTLGALWEDTKFGIAHFNDIEKIAIVGERGWEAAMAAFIKPFTRAHVRYFNADQIDEAGNWTRK